VKTSSFEARHDLAWLALPVFAVLNGLVRDTTYGPSMGRDLSHSVSVVPLLIAIVAWALWVAKRLPLPDSRTALRVGVAWLALTLAFEFGLGALQGLSMEEMLAEYDITRGRLWPLIPLATLLAPPLVYAVATLGSRPADRPASRAGRGPG
jgi:hypothetical protein